MANYEDKILQAVQTIVDNAIRNAQFDITIAAKIIECTDEQKGIYRIKYQDIITKAYSNNLKNGYKKDDEVYVLVPSANMSGNKIIIGPIINLNGQR